MRWTQREEAPLAHGELRFFRERFSVGLCFCFLAGHPMSRAKLLHDCIFGTVPIMQKRQVQPACRSGKKVDSTLFLCF
ncbi:MAG: hypothetical protein DWH94_11285 [Planctomycetota bacterium]|nr:MAG: hypothetical protein DWH94_11285 [Planctomycetota bacterium]